jgi:uncharacterized protein YraI
MLLLTPGCALVNQLVDMPTPTPAPQRALRPTFTPTPIILTPVPTESLPAVAEATATPVSFDQAAGSAAAAPAPAAPPADASAPPVDTLEPAATQIPLAVVQDATARARSGPGTIYDDAGELAGGAELAIVARSDDAAWWLVCCLSDQEVWVPVEAVAIEGAVEAVAVAANIPPAPTPTETPEPRPMAVVAGPLVNLRAGPGTDFDVLNQASQDTRLEIVGRNEAGDWWQVCCVDGQPGWISGELVTPEGPVERVALAPDLPTATPVPTATPQPTATDTPQPELTAPAPEATPEGAGAGETTPFELTQSEEFPFGDNDYLRVGAKVRDASDQPLGGFYLRIRNETTGQQWLSRQAGSRAWEYSAPSAGFDDFREINLEFDTAGQAGLAGNSYAIWLVDGGGRRVSPVVPFEQADSDPQWLYIVLTQR